jgi:hypothetical protein
MDTMIKGVINTPPKPGSEDPAEKRITFLLLRETERDEISCMSSLHFNPASTTLAVGTKVVLFGDWVTALPSGTAIPLFVFSRVALA